MQQHPQSNAWESSGKYQGDMLLTENQVEAMTDAYAGRSAYILPNTKWPDATAVYEFGDGEFSMY
jgi:hypothetical protein